MTSQFHNLAVKLTDLLPDGIARFQQRSDRSYQLRTALDQILGSHGEDIELGTDDDETEVLEKAANMVLEIALDLDQQRPAGQQRPDRVKKSSATNIWTSRSCIDGCGLRPAFNADRRSRPLEPASHSKPGDRQLHNDRSCGARRRRDRNSDRAEVGA
jgi:hypothetical protein